ncbi:MAG: glycoside hydrolase family 95 protein, partial [Armatimonadetes bacterium]|nr:glycoside hydrolase family 95 protein [Armatimonadota bacterium]
MNSSLWYRTPPCEWKEGLPVGNGVLAGMVCGSIEKERIALNHEWLWRATHRERDVEEKHQHLAEIRRLFFEGKVFESGTLANQRLGGPGGVSGTKNRVGSYQPVGDLFLEFQHGEVSNYRRELNLATGIVTVNYTAGDGSYQREILAHAAMPLLMIRVKSEVPCTFKAALARLEDPECDLSPWMRADAFGFSGTFVEGLQFAAEARVVLKSGNTTPVDGADAALMLTDCSEAVIHVSMAVAIDGGDATGQCRQQLEAGQESWGELLETHVEQHRRVYSRVTIDLGSGREDLPADERLAAWRSGKTDEGLIALYFNFGRYLLQASSLGASVPVNLQGKWNEELKPPWECDLHNDVN